MITKIKRYFKNLREDLKRIDHAQNQLWSTQKLQSLFGEGHFVPQTGWSMTPQAIVHTLNIISLSKPECILEFGSGATTMYVAKLLRNEGSKARFFSVESDLEWKEKMEKQLAAYGLLDYVNIIYAPIQKVDPSLAFKEQQTWYDTKILAEGIGSIANFDFILVDGPFGGGTPFARYSAFPFLKDKTNRDSIWLLDDTNRAHESEILNEWQKQSEFTRRSFSRYALLMHPKKFDFTPYNMQ